MIDAGAAKGSPVRRCVGDLGAELRWEGVDAFAYKSEGSAPFAGISRHLLFGGAGGASELRYFEITPGGYSTLERHRHTHQVVVLRGRGRCLVAGGLFEIGLHDLVTVPEWTWHQFRADAGGPLGFLCLVDAARDAPVLPTPADLAILREDPAFAEFIRA